MDAPEPLHVHDRAAYRIVVQGVLDERWSDWMEGMRIVGVPAPDGIPLTVLEGELADQSALVGVISALHTLSLPVVSVKCLDRHAPAPPVTP
jgi:hypothetical protein